jgi:uncharacterized membrane protein YphA (DoxX/SURF4 family)
MTDDRTPLSPAVAAPWPLTSAVFLLRLGIGWHFLYEGVVKLVDPTWTAAGYLRGSTGPLAESFHALAANDAILRVVDALNVWGLILVGACLMWGLLTRFSAVCGMLMLALYYVSNPPWFAAAAGMGEGHYLLVNKNLIEFFALFVVLVQPARRLGIDGALSAWWRSRRSSMPRPAPATTAVPADSRYVPDGLTRRQLLTSMAGLPLVGAFVLSALQKHGYRSFEEDGLTNQLADADAVTSPSKTFSWARLEDLKGEVPKGKIKDLELSRMILGGNLIGGWAHARDLIYVSKLVKAYHHREKIFETFRLAEACGVNTILTNPLLCETINDYWENGGGNIQFISDCGGKDVLAMIQKSIDGGASACYVQGGIADRLVEEENYDLIEQSLELIRKNGLPAGIGGHKLATIQKCVERGFEPDFWMKTLHRTNYWSAQPEQKHDNIWCEEPDDTVAFMQEVKQPWIAFKVLAAGALRPEVGFKYAFQSGADFICVGMYDFQIVDDVNIAVNVLNGDLKRRRQWLA